MFVAVVGCKYEKRGGDGALRLYGSPGGEGRAGRGEVRF